MNDRQSHILIVDDRTDNIEILASILGSEYRISFALYGNKALQIASSSEPPDLILLDIMMPGVNGYEVCRELKANPQTAKIPIIFVSAKDEEIDEAKGLGMGVVDYLTKPVRPLIVKERVKTHLKLRHAAKELEKQNEILEENARLREEAELLSRHDLKSPLSAFISIPRMLAKEKNLTPDQVEMLGMLAKSGNRMLQTINRYLDMGKMELGKYKINPVPVDLVQVVLQVFQELTGLSASEGITCTLYLNREIAGQFDKFEVPGDESLFFCMLSNLVKNAIEASKPGDDVRVILDESSFPSIAIKNQGVIPQQIQERFFERYTTFGKEGGTGLGAYSAKLMATILGGKISFTSNETQGTTLRVTFQNGEFPQEAPGTASELGIGRMKPRNTLCVLIADGNPLIRRIITNLLREMGVTHIFGVGNGDDAIDLMEGTSLDLIIADRFLSKKSGIAIFSFMKDRTAFKDTRFILTTGQMTKEAAIEAIQLGIGECVVKPFSPDVLRQKIEKILEK